MGTVYRATHLLIDRPVAVKVLNPRFVEDEAAQTRFRREARAAGRLQHANAVTVTDFGRSEDGYVYIVMELLEGKTLREVLAREAPLDAARAVSLMLQVSAAVAAAHEAGIIHRDLKPANIFIVQRPSAPTVVKVLDFGIAKLAAEALEDDDPQTLTQVGVMIGTPRYMSPEQCDGAKHITPGADVYSLGIILYEMLTGMTPFAGSTPLAVALKHSSERPKPPREIIPNIPPALEEVIMHALEKRAEDRPPDAGAFRRELYMTAESLGLEHAASANPPTIEALRNAGTETPSGRLVIDIERLRQSRASASVQRETTVLADVAGEADGQKQDSPAGAVVPVPASAPPLVAAQAPAGAAALDGRKASPVARFRIFLDRNRAGLARMKKPAALGWTNWVRQPPVMIIGGLVLLTAIVLIAALGFRAPATSVNGNGNDNSAVAAKSPAKAGASPSPDASPRERPRESRERREPEKEREVKSPPRQVQKPKDSRSVGGKVWNSVKKVKKIKNIFKKPF
jgi:serine/threonine protein kinase